MKRLFLLPVVALIISACAGEATPSVTPDGTLKPYYEQSVEWSKCNDTLECATIKVPLDYDDLTAGDIDLKVARHKATSQSQIVVFVNPGGPGGSGIDYLKYWNEQFSEELNKYTDLVSWDPRGVQGSSPIDCITDAELDAALSEDPTPDTEAEVENFWSTGETQNQQCEAKNGDLLNHVSTVETAKDLDVLRVIFKQETLNYLGKSYGTQLGAVYAKLFTDKVGKFVLDGAVDVQLSTKQMSLDQAVGFDLAINRMAQYCLQTYDSCPLGSSVKQITAKISAFMNQLDQKPLKTDNPDRPLTESMGWNAIIMPNYVADGGWDWLIEALGTAYDGDGSDLLSISDWATSRNPNGTYADNSTEAFAAISCLDSGATTDKDIAAIIPEFNAAAPVFGTALAWGESMCVGWRGKGIKAPTDVTVDVATPIVVIGTKYDPATPMKWAQALTSELGDATFVEYVGDGHTAYFSGSSCIDDYIDNFFLHDQQIPAGTVCQADNPLLD